MSRAASAMIESSGRGRSSGNPSRISRDVRLVRLGLMQISWQHQHCWARFTTGSGNECPVEMIFDVVTIDEVNPHERALLTAGDCAGVL
jgi:hypothetical protein